MKPFPVMLVTMLMLWGQAASSTALQERDEFHVGNAFSQPSDRLAPQHRDRFAIGSALFQQPWVVAPAPTPLRDGLGPLFNANTCQACHVKGGRGHPPLTPTDPFMSMLIRLGHPPKTAQEEALAQQKGTIPDLTYGDQLQPNGIPGVAGEGTPRVTDTSINGQFQDGETYTLLKPTLRIDSLNYGKLDAQTQLSARVAPALPGVGLLEAIPETDILDNADPDDRNADGISGRPNRVWDISKQQTVLGRFGWKANQPSVIQQAATAFNRDIGITSPLLPEPSCTAHQPACQSAPNGGKPEISQASLENVALYVALLAVPARRDTYDPQVQAGEHLFQQAGCAACHISHFHTGDQAAFPELANQDIQPYTDLLLHDMGEGLADNRPDFSASGNEWRTAPLWGIGLVGTVNGHTRFLHDGRARNIMEAILWHDGEGKKSRNAVLDMSKAQREALLCFLNSL